MDSEGDSSVFSVSTSASTVAPYHQSVLRSTGTLSLDTGECHQLDVATEPAINCTIIRKDGKFLRTCNGSTLPNFESMLNDTLMPVELQGRSFVDVATACQKFSSRCLQAGCGKNERLLCLDGAACPFKHDHVHCSQYSHEESKQPCLDGAACPSRNDPLHSAQYSHEEDVPTSYLDVPVWDVAGRCAQDLDPEKLVEYQWTRDEIEGLYEKAGPPYVGGTVPQSWDDQMAHEQSFVKLGPVPKKCDNSNIARKRRTKTADWIFRELKADLCEGLICRCKDSRCRARRVYPAGRDSEIDSPRHRRLNAFVQP